MSSRLRISLVIPVYNEESHLAACLQRAVRQRRRFDEIIVVDNNSTDDTVAIAARFPEVTVIHEPQQGVVHARNRGFDTASGDIIARIDADTRLPDDWTQCLEEIFVAADVAAVSGRMEYYDMPWQHAFNRIDLTFRRYFARRLGREVALQAANMAIRRSAWRRIRSDTCNRGGLHEDFDLAIHATAAGYRVRFDERLRAAIAYRQADSSLRSFARYALLSPRTYRQHGLTSQRCMYPVVGLAIACYFLLKLAHRGYDAETARFSVARLVATPISIRVNPATYVD